MIPAPLQIAVFPAGTTPGPVTVRNESGGSPFALLMQVLMNKEQPPATNELETAAAPDSGRPMQFNMPGGVRPGMAKGTAVEFLQDGDATGIQAILEIEQEDGGIIELPVVLIPPEALEQAASPLVATENKTHSAEHWLAALTQPDFMVTESAHTDKSSDDIPATAVHDGKLPIERSGIPVTASATGYGSELYALSADGSLLLSDTAQHRGLHQAALPPPPHAAGETPGHIHRIAVPINGQAFITPATGGRIENPLAGFDDVSGDVAGIPMNRVMDNGELPRMRLTLADGVIGNFPDRSRINPETAIQHSNTDPAADGGNAVRVEVAGVNEQSANNSHHTANEGAAILRMAVIIPEATTSGHGVAPRHLHQLLESVAGQGEAPVAVIELSDTGTMVQLDEPVSFQRYVAIAGRNGSGPAADSRSPDSGTWIPDAQPAYLKTAAAASASEAQPSTPESAPAHNKPPVETVVQRASGFTVAGKGTGRQFGSDSESVAVIQDAGSRNVSAMTGTSDSGAPAPTRAKGLPHVQKPIPRGRAFLQNMTLDMPVHSGEISKTSSSAGPEVPPHGERVQQAAAAAVQADGVSPAAADDPADRAVRGKTTADSRESRRQIIMTGGTVNRASHGAGTADMPDVITETPASAGPDHSMHSRQSASGATVRFRNITIQGTATVAINDTVPAESAAFESGAATHVSAESATAGRRTQEPVVGMPDIENHQQATSSDGAGDVRFRGTETGEPAVKNSPVNSGRQPEAPEVPTTAAASAGGLEDPAGGVQHEPGHAGMREAAGDANPNHAAADAARSERRDGVHEHGAMRAPAVSRGDIVGRASAETSGGSTGGGHDMQSFPRPGAAAQWTEHAAPEGQNFTMPAVTAVNSTIPTGDRDVTDSPDGIESISGSSDGTGVHTKTVSETAASVKSGQATFSSEAAERHEQVVATIVRHARFMAQQGRSTATIRLEPPSLGRVRLEISTDHTRVTGRIVVEKAEVRDMVQHHLPELRDSLAQNGLKVESFDVQVGHNSGTDAWARRHLMESRHGMPAQEAASGDSHGATASEAARTVRTNRVIGNGNVDIWI